MQNNEYYIVGQMSGTSLDGIDLVFVKIGFKRTYFFEILNAETIKYTKKWQQKLANGFLLKGKELKALDIEYGNLLGEKINDFIYRNQINTLDFIASHGHTIFHKPTEGYTLQIGNGPHISQLTNYKTICDFRVQDVEFGGQGAPLVPIGDQLLFSEYDYCLNIGGFANISTEMNSERIAFDICPANIVLNYYARKLGLEYDNKGEIASKGTINSSLLKELNTLNFYADNAPKSLGFEFVETKILPIIKKYDIEIKDILRTFIEHISTQISAVLKQNNTTCLVTGGGVFNDFLMHEIQKKTALKLIIPTNLLVNYKEALVFAFLGYLKNLNHINCLKSVTGALQNHSSGIIHYPS